MVLRFNHCWKRLDELRQFEISNKPSSDVDVFVDENWLNKLTHGSYLWLPENVNMENASVFWRDNSHIPKIMYFVGIAQPRLVLNFDGRILFKPLFQEVKAKRTSAIRSASTIMLQTTQMDRKKVNEVIKEVIKYTVSLSPPQKRILLIADGVDGHGVGKNGQIGLKKALRNVRDWIMNNSRPRMPLHKYNIEFLIQPAQSPDLNILDLVLGGHYRLLFDPNWIQRAQKLSEILRDLNDTALHSWNSWHRNHVLAKQQNTLNCHN